MINTEKLLNFLIKKKIFFFTGVPDSILKNIINAIENNRKIKHLISANEGTALATAIGYNLATKMIPCVYMQNSGLGNSINPLISISNKNIYSIPTILMIGWRGSPNEIDEPQHMVKGKITPALLKLLGIKYLIFNKDKDFNKLSELIKFSKKNRQIVAFLVKNKSLTDIKKIKNPKNPKKLISRQKFISDLLKEIPLTAKIISTTGYTSRELLQVRKLNNLKKGKDFYMVGGMGHASSVALGMSMFKTKKQIICLDGDGSVLMHGGSLPINGLAAGKNFKHIMLNNSSHESVGGFKTIANSIDFDKISKGSGYKNYFKISNKDNCKKILKKFLSSNGPSFLEVLISKGALKNLIRPSNLKKIKQKFIID